jgi:hypothetical protein
MLQLFWDPGADVPGVVHDNDLIAHIKEKKFWWPKEAESDIISICRCYRQISTGIPAGNQLDSGYLLVDRYPAGPPGEFQ